MTEHYAIGPMDEQQQFHRDASAAIYTIGKIAAVLNWPADEDFRAKCARLEKMFSAENLKAPPRNENHT